MISNAALLMSIIGEHFLSGLCKFINRTFLTHLILDGRSDDLFTFAVLALIEHLDMISPKTQDLFCGLVTDFSKVTYLADC